MGKTTLDTFSTITGWSAPNGSISEITNDPEYPHALKITTRSGASGQAVKVFPSTNLVGKGIYFRIKALNVVQQISIELAVTSNYAKTFGGAIQNYASRLNINTWQYIGGPLNGLPPAGETIWADMAAIIGIKITVVPTSGVQEILISEIVTHDMSLPTGIIWQFDDGYSACYDTAFSILSAQSYVGSVAVANDLVGTAGHCLLSQLQEMHAASWEMVTHGKTHNMFTTLSAEDLTAELIASKNYIKNNFCDECSHNLVYPGGGYNAAVINAVKNYFITARTVSEYPRGILTRIGDLHLLPSCAYILNTTTLANAKILMDRLYNSGGQMLFVFHNLVSEAPTTYQWLISDFTELVAYAKSLGFVSYKMRDLFPFNPPKGINSLGLSLLM